MTQANKHGWRLRWLLRRNRLVADPRFQAWAARFPPTRLVARRRARDLFDLTAGFVYSQILAGFVESGLLAALAEAPLTLAQAAEKAGLDEAATLTLLKAAASLDLAEQAQEKWTLGQRGAALAGTAGIADMIRHHRLLYADLAEPMTALREKGGGQLARLWHYDEAADPASVGAYSRLMAASQPMVAAQATAAVPFRRFDRLLDIGGGEGAFLAAIADHAPRLGLGLFDLPQVAARAAAKQAGLAGRISFHPGSFLNDALPGGYDLHSLVRVLHDHDDEAAQRILAASRAALPDGGALLVLEPMARDGAAPEGHAYFGLYLTAMGQGRPRTPNEIIAMAQRAGFRRARALRTPLPLVARALLLYK